MINLTKKRMISFALLCIAFLTQAVLAQTSIAPWSKQNLYDPNTDAYYIPYELWTGAKWDGSKIKSNHSADIRFMGNKAIKGPKSWVHPKLNMEYTVYERINGNKTQLFTFYDDGIGRVSDNRKNRYFNGGIKFPAGPGWKIGKKVTHVQDVWKKDKFYSRNTSILINSIKFNSDGNMTSLTYTYFVDGTPDHRYSYSPEKGMTEVEKL